MKSRLFHFLLFCLVVTLPMANCLADTRTEHRSAPGIRPLVILPTFLAREQGKNTPPSSSAVSASLSAEADQTGPSTARKQLPPPRTIESVLQKELNEQTQEESSTEVLKTLASLMETQKQLQEQITDLTEKLKTTHSNSEKQSLQEELDRLDKELAEINSDFERIATGVNPSVFLTSKETAFSWKEELTTLLEPSIKELKQLTARARMKSELKEKIATYDKQIVKAQQALGKLNRLITKAEDRDVKEGLDELLPAWENMERRVNSKRDIALRELTKLEEHDASFLASSKDSIREFFRNRGLYLFIAFLTVIGILAAFRLLGQLLFSLLPGAKKEQRPMHIRVLDIVLRILSVICAVSGLIFVLYVAEDWFLLSAAIIFIVALVWAIRQTLPKMWRQVQMLLNMGSIREGERVFYQGIPWRVETINVLCILYNPTLDIHLRIPIADMTGLISRPYRHDESWFPCKKGDWVAIDGKPFARVTALSHEQVELVESGGRHITYRTADFLSKAPANLSNTFTVQIVVGLSYILQSIITTTVLETLTDFLQRRLEEHGYAEDCLSLSVDLLQIGPSSLDVAIMAGFKGKQASSYRKIERTLTKWAVDCCNINNWELPFPQLTVHTPADETI
ncbi:MAG: hypothetical protein GXY53_10245 [Desulfobulbus sp.]|nr:hypothetical protein [Desulfobulbus sp.]